jgi:hypothetical protein
MAEERQVYDVINQLGALMQEAIQTHGWAVAMAALAVTVAQGIHAGEHLGGERNALLGNWLYALHEQLAYLNGKCDQEKAVRRAGKDQLPN